MKKFFVAAAAVLLMASCSTTKPLYSWYNSEDASYQYTKHLTEQDLAHAMAQYEKVITQQKGSRATVPPGASAEYGYLLVKSGQKAKGLELMKAEMNLYPESKVFISRIVKQLEK